MAECAGKRRSKQCVHEEHHVEKSTDFCEDTSGLSSFDGSLRPGDARCLEV